MAEYWFLGWLATTLVTFLVGRHVGATFAIREFEKRGDRLSSLPGDLVYDLWELVNATSMWPGRRRQFHRSLDMLRQKLPMENPERAE